MRHLFLGAALGTGILLILAAPWWAVAPLTIAVTVATVGVVAAREQL